MGLGLIGGSILQSLKSRSFKGSTFGIDSNLSAITQANKLGLIINKDKNKNKDNNNIEIPSVAFLGQPYELTPFTAAFGIKAASYRNFGPYYYISDYNTAIKEGSWTSNYLKRFLFGKSISDSNGKYYNGSIIRFAIFFGNFRTILYRPTDPFFSYFHALDNKYNLSDTSFKKFMDKSKNFTGQWANFYDALIIQNIKYKNY